MRWVGVSLFWQGDLTPGHCVFCGRVDVDREEM